MIRILHNENLIILTNDPPRVISGWDVMMGFVIEIVERLTPPEDDLAADNVPPIIQGSG